MRPRATSPPDRPRLAEAAGGGGEAGGAPFLLDRLVLFVRLLRRAGIPTAPDDAALLARALARVDLGRREEVFHAARAVLVHRREDLDLFAFLFARFFAGAAAGRRRPERPRDPSRRAARVATFWGRARGERHGEREVRDRSGTASELERLAAKPFAAMTPEELARAEELVARLRWAISTRRTRRRVRDRRGDALDPARLLRDAARRGGAVPTLPRRRRKDKERPVVLLADVSGSMERASRLVLQLFWALGRRLPSVESFVFGTRLTRITPLLETGSARRALEEVARRVPDLAGGTRIGDSLARFEKRWGRRVLGRGAVVVIVSDGWERGDPERLAAAVASIAARCHRLVWANPLAGSPSYRPEAAGMAAALPYVDDFLPVDRLDSLAGLARHLERLPERRRGRRPRPARRSVAGRQESGGGRFAPPLKARRTQ